MCYSHQEVFTDAKRERSRYGNCEETDPFCVTGIVQRESS